MVQRVLEYIRKYFCKHSLSGKIIIFSVLSLFPVLLMIQTKSIVFGDDFYFHLSRLSSLLDSVSGGDIFPFIHSESLMGQGYGYGFYYSNLFYYPFVLFRLLGFNATVSYLMFVFLTNFIKCIISYCSFLMISKNKESSIIFTILYALTLYHFIDIGQRSALSEFVALAFLPLVIAGIITIVSQDEKQWWVLSIGMTFVIYAHLLTGIICVIFVFLFMFLNLKILVDVKRVLSLVKATVLTILLTIALFVPLFEQMMNLDLVVGNYKWVSMYQGTTSVLGMLQTLLTYDGYANLGVISLIMIFFIVVKIREISNLNKKLLIVLTIFFIMLLPYFPWKQLQNTFLDIIQFPWRFLGIITLIITWIFVSLKEKRSVVIVLITISILNIYSFNQKIVSDYPLMEFDDLNRINSNLLKGNEFLHLGADPGILYFHGGKILVNGDIASNLEVSYPKQNQISFYFSDYEEKEYTIPKIYYMGYLIYATEDVTIVNMGFDQNGQVVVTAKGEGIITLYYKRTLLQNVSAGISTFSLIGFTYFLIKTYTKRKRVNQKL